MADMTGQVALVTGGVRGIGAAITERLVDRGVKVAAGHSRHSETARQFAAKFDGMVSTHHGNISSNADCERVIGEVLDQHGRLDILVNNAGITADKTVRRMTPEDWDRVVHVNLFGAFYLFGLTMSLAQETARKGITVNDVAPGYISTEMVAAVPQEAMDKVIAKIPVGRLGEPDEVARMVEFLADPDSGYITGQIFSVNGGMYM